jgi:hypothetical protein
LPSPEEDSNSSSVVLLASTTAYQQKPLLEDSKIKGVRWDGESINRDRNLSNDDILGKREYPILPFLLAYSLSAAVIPFRPYLFTGGGLLSFHNRF